jgi:hypothetical protein
LAPHDRLRAVMVRDHVQEAEVRIAEMCLPVNR